MFGFFKYFLTLLKISSFSLCSSSLLLSSLTTFIIIDINTSLVDHLSPLPLVVLGFYLVPSFTYFSVVSGCLICCFYIYLLERLVAFPNSGEMVFCRRHHMHPTLVTDIYALGVYFVGAVKVLLL